MDAQLREAGARYVLDQLFVDDLPRIAIDAVTRGIESPSLIALAGATRADEPNELRALFERALVELGLPTPTRLEAAELLKCRYARDVVEGICSPRSGAQRIVNLYHEVYDELRSVTYAGDGFGIAALLGNLYSLDDIPEGDVSAERRIDASLRDDCAEIALAGCDEAD